MIINYFNEGKYYEKLNKPDYGNKFEENVEVSTARRHVKDIHDDYTPLGLFPTEETQVCTPIVDGWNSKFQYTIGSNSSCGLASPSISNINSILFENKFLKY